MTTFSYTTRDGDTLDKLAFDFYGTTSGQVVETVLSANPGLAKYGPILPAGVVINLPQISEPQKTTGVRLWD